MNEVNLEKTEKEIEYPYEITFKAIFRNIPDVHENLNSVLDSFGIQGIAAEHKSSHKKFISFTITGEIKSKEMLDDVCFKISSLQGYMTMF